MSETKPSGSPLVPDDESPIVQEVADIGPRGRFHILPRWAKRTGWLPVPAKSEELALMIFVEPGHLSIQKWEPEGPRIIERFNQIAEERGDPLLLRLIQDRYSRLLIPRDRRVYLGSSALQHLGLSTDRTVKTSVYITVIGSGVDLLSADRRNELAIAGSPELDDLP